MFIVFEGVDGVGKTSLAERVCHYLTEKGIATFLTQEPRGTPLGVLVGDFVDKNSLFLTDLTKLHLFSAARDDHVTNKILPALREGKTVLCDRFWDSSVVYQCNFRGWFYRTYGASVGLNAFNTVSKAALSGLMPDVTFILDSDDEEEILRRLKSRRNASEVYCEDCERRHVRDMKACYLSDLPNYPCGKKPLRVVIDVTRRSIDELVQEVLEELDNLKENRLEGFY